MIETIFTVIPLALLALLAVLAASAARNRAATILLALLFVGTVLLGLFAETGALIAERILIQFQGAL